MRRVAFWKPGLLAAAVLAAAPAFYTPGAHCPSKPPEVELHHPAPGVAVHKACYADYGTCFVDTFHTDTLRRELVEKYKSNRYAAFAYVDSVRNYLTYDTVYYQGEIYYIDSFQTERIHISIHTSLKDSLPVKKLTFTDRWIAIPNQPFATTYSTLADTPFVAFFNEYDSLHKLGIGPMDGCFYEPTAYTIFGNRLHKKGQEGNRMPGISLAMEDFFAAVGRAPVEVPPVGIHGKPPYRRAPVSAPGGGSRFDVNGRRIPARKGRTWSYAPGEPPRLDPGAEREAGPSGPVGPIGPIGEGKPE